MHVSKTDNDKLIPSKKYIVLRRKNMFAEERNLLLNI